MENNLKSLLEIFDGKGESLGFTYKKVFEAKNWYIYEVNSERLTHYEVFKKRNTKICIDFKEKIFSEDRREIYPNSKQFGFTAWTVGTLERAKEIILEKEASAEISL